MLQVECFLENSGAFTNILAASIRTLELVSVTKSIKLGVNGIEIGWNRYFSERLLLSESVTDLKVAG